MMECGWLSSVCSIFIGQAFLMGCELGLSEVGFCDRLFYLRNLGDLLAFLFVAPVFQYYVLHAYRVI